jgi:COMPASS component SPP1
MRSQVADLVNQVIFGSTDTTISHKGGSSRKPRPRATSREESDSEYQGISGKPKRQKKSALIAAAAAPITTVRYIDGQEVTCEDEDWEGNCSLCGKAWTDAKGQMLESIACDKCDQWFHFHCVGIEQAPSGDFVCPKCRS